MEHVTLKSKCSGLNVPAKPIEKQGFLSKRIIVTLEISMYVKTEKLDNLDKKV